MPTRRKPPATKKPARRAAPARASGAARPRAGTGARTTAAEALAWLERKGTRKNVAALARYGIPATNALGVTVGDTKAYAKRLGTDHDLALALWKSGVYEARLLAAFVDDPTRVTPRQMDAWAADFDSWAVVDTVCFHLFDRTPHAWKKAKQWAKAKPEFTKRAAFALIWALSVHDKSATDATFRACFPLVERAATDERDLVKKAVDMALRAIGKRNAALNAAAIATARGLAERDDATARWIGKHALRELQSASVRKRVGRTKR